MVTVDIKAYNKCYRRKLLLDICLSKKKLKSFVIQMYSIKMFFLHLQLLVQYNCGKIIGNSDAYVSV